MKLVYELNPNTKIEVECVDAQEVIRQLTYIRESIGHEVCGQCKSEYTILRHREVDGNDFYEHVCLDCNAVLNLGQNKDSKMLYKKKMRTNAKGKAEKGEDGKGQYLPKDGWGRYNSLTKEVEY